MTYRVFISPVDEGTPCEGWQIGTAKNVQEAIDLCLPQGFILIDGATPVIYDADQAAARYDVPPEDTGVIEIAVVGNEASAA